MVWFDDERLRNAWMVRIYQAPFSIEESDL